MYLLSGEIAQITVSLAFPPNDSLNKWVKQEPLYKRSSDGLSVSLDNESTKCLHQHNESNNSYALVIVKLAVFVVRYLS